MTGQPTPGFLRGSAVNQIVGIMHQAHAGGPWALESAETETVIEGVPNGLPGYMLTTLTFAVGVLYAESRDVDTRPRVVITVQESSGR